MFFLTIFCYLAFSGCYFTQKIIRAQINYPIQYSVLVSALVAASVSYTATTTRTKACQAAWMAAEDMHSVLKEDSY